MYGDAGATSSPPPDWLCCATARCGAWTASPPTRSGPPPRSGSCWSRSPRTGRSSWAGTRRHRSGSGTEAATTCASRTVRAPGGGSRRAGGADSGGAGPAGLRPAELRPSATACPLPRGRRRTGLPAAPRPPQPGYGQHGTAACPGYGRPATASGARPPGYAPAGYAPYGARRCRPAGSWQPGPASLVTASLVMACRAGQPGHGPQGPGPRRRSGGQRRVLAGGRIPPRRRRRGDCLARPPITSAAATRAAAPRWGSAPPPRTAPTVTGAAGGGVRSSGW